MKTPFISSDEMTKYIEEHTKAPIIRTDTYKGHTIIIDSDNWRPYMLLAPEFVRLRPITTRYRTLAAAKAGITEKLKRSAWHD